MGVDWIMGKGHCSWKLFEGIKVVLWGAVSSLKSVVREEQDCSLPSSWFPVLPCHVLSCIDSHHNAIYHEVIEPREPSIRHQTDRAAPSWTFSLQNCEFFFIKYLALTILLQHQKLV